MTGISGSIGAHFFAHFMKNTDWEVVGIASFKHKGWMDKILVMVDAHPEWLSRLTMVIHDLSAPFSELTRKKIGKIDYIVNLASLSDVEASIQNPVPFVRNNVDVVLTMLEFARDIWGLRESNSKPPAGTAFIQISTDEVYGPVATKNDPGVKEWGEIAPSNPYAASKAAQEAIAFSYWRTYNVPVIITNTMNNFGELQQSSKFPSMVQRWIAKGEKVMVHGEKRGDKVEIGSRSYIHSRNFADAILFILKNCPAYLHQPDSVDKPDRYNIAGDRQLDNLELAKEIAHHMGKDDFEYEVVNVHTLRPGHDRHYALDNSKIKSLGWKSPVTFEESLKNTIQWQMEHPEWLTY